MKTKEEILISVYGCKDLEDLKKCFLDNDISLAMILKAMKEYAAQFKQSDYTPSEPLSIFPQIF